jgi:acyl-CoA synthetase (AMP-forming)/AMP-acid ligase II
MNLIGTCATNRVTGSREPENEGQHILDRPVRCLQYWRLRCGGAAQPAAPPLPSLSRQKVPRSIVFEAELPRLPTGKLYKRLFRDRYWGGPTSRIL